MSNFDPKSIISDLGPTRSRPGLLKTTLNTGQNQARCPYRPKKTTKTTPKRVLKGVILGHFAHSKTTPKWVILTHFGVVSDPL